MSWFGAASIFNSTLKWNSSDGAGVGGPPTAGGRLPVLAAPNRNRNIIVRKNVVMKIYVADLRYPRYQILKIEPMVFHEGKEFAELTRVTLPRDLAGLVLCSPIVFVSDRVKVA